MDRKDTVVAPTVQRGERGEKGDRGEAGLRGQQGSDVGVTTSILGAYSKWTTV